MWAGISKINAVPTDNILLTAREGNRQGVATTRIVLCRGFLGGGPGGDRW